VTISIHHKNSIIENFKEKVLNNKQNDLDDYEIESYNNSRAIEDFYKYSNKLLENENFISNYKKSKDKNNVKINRINNNLDKVRELVDKYNDNSKK